jgi:hypothetical protein
MEKNGNKLSRRTLFAGATGVGAVAAAASLLPGFGVSSAGQPSQAKAALTKGGGYQLSEHVKHYYKTTSL